MIFYGFCFWIPNSHGAIQNMDTKVKILDGSRFWVSGIQIPTFNVRDPNKTKRAYLKTFYYLNAGIV